MTSKPSGGMSDKEMDDAIHRAMRSGATEPPLLTQVTEAMAGRTWWFNVVGVAVLLAFTALAVLSVVRFFHSTETRDMIMWATIFIFCDTSVGMLKLWYWVRMNRNAVTREVKRLELQVARLIETRRED
jgi:hypothetical protein